MAAAAADVAEVIPAAARRRAPHLLVGLSLGGKVALQLLKQLVELQEAQQQQAGKAEHHLYSHAPGIEPPEDQPPSAAAAKQVSAKGSSVGVTELLQRPHNQEQQQQQQQPPASARPAPAGLGAGLSAWKRPY